MKNQYLRNLKNDIPAGIVVFFVAIPLCLGIALASEAPLISGLLAGIIGGIVVGFFSGSQVGVSGPAAGLVAIVINAVHDLGTFEAFLLSVFFAGIIQILFGLFKGGIIAYFFPNAVIKGMLSAIGAIIIIKQIPHVFGYDSDFLGDTNFFQPDGENTFSELLKMKDYINPASIIVSITSLIILIVWEKYIQKIHKVFQLLQGPIVVVIVGIMANILFNTYNLGIAFNDKELVNIPEIKNLHDFKLAMTFPDFSFITNHHMWFIALTIAIVASLETLLCVEATDKLDPLKRITPTNRELIAQGIGNSIGGLIGALPITQVIVRSSANITFGGRTKVAAITHGILIFLSLFLFPGILNMIPYSSLAAILLIVGYKLVNPSLFKSILKEKNEQYVPFLITFLGIVFTDLLIGISLGLVTGIIYLLKNNMKTSFKIENVGNYKVIILPKELTFLDKAALRKALLTIEEGSFVKIDFREVKNIHPDIIDIIDDFMASAIDKNIKVELIK
jgi:MFS superfamily sulfate permease-like transporter